MTAGVVSAGIGLDRMGVVTSGIGTSEDVLLRTELVELAELTKLEVKLEVELDSPKLEAMLSVRELDERIDVTSVVCDVD